MTSSVGVLAEAAPRERRVALPPDVAGKLVAAGFDVVVQKGAGLAASFPDEQYAAAGARVAGPAAVLKADVLLGVSRPLAKTTKALRDGQVLMGLFRATDDAAWAGEVARRGATLVSLDGLPRTLSRAQGMDALTSQASIAGYRAVLVAAGAFQRFFPMLSTAAGTMPPARVLVLGAGVAGLQAIGTARRLGAVVSSYDVRPQARADAESVGATFLELTSVADGAGAGGYARELTPEEQAAQRAELDGHIASHDVVITTAQVPGRTPPRLVSAQALAQMRAGSVVLDMAASSLGGNVEGSVADETVVVGAGVTVIGAGNLASDMATAASMAYGRNLSSLLLHLAPGGELAIDLTDEIHAGVVVTHGGRVVHPALAGGAA